jgi:hypothetical protein
MNRRRDAAQSLVEFAVLAPLLCLLAVMVWDAGSVLREQLILADAAGAGARVMATAYAGAPGAQVISAVRQAAADVPLAAADPISVDPLTGTVVVSHTHELYTPLLRQLWGNGTGVVTLQGRAQFWLPAAAPTPAAVPAPAAPCSFNLRIPPLDNNVGWFSPPFVLGNRADSGYFLGRILVHWDVGLTRNIKLALFEGNPFAGQSNPLEGSQHTPNKIPGVLIIEKEGGSVTSMSIDASGLTAGRTYTAYFYNFGARVDVTSVGTVTLLKSNCP